MQINFSKNNTPILPKPNFQRIPKKKKYGLILTILLLITILLSILIKYQTNKKSKKSKNTGTKSDIKTLQPSVKDNQEDTTYQTALNEYTTFKNRKNTKITEDINKVQQCLQEEIKNPQRFIQPGTYQELNAPIGMYHLVVVSHLSKKQAMNSVQKLLNDNQGVYLITPRNGEKYYRVTIGHSKTQYEAEQKLHQLSPYYKNLFVLRY